MSWAPSASRALPGSACKHALTVPPIFRLCCHSSIQTCKHVQRNDSPGWRVDLPWSVWESRRCMAASAAPSNQAVQRGAGVLPADHLDSPFHELAVPDIWEGIGRTRVRQHVNPLRREHQVVTGAPDWSTTFQQPSAPLAVDLGCGPGRFLLLMQYRRARGTLNIPALGSPGQPVNYLGLEIRKPLVDRANEWSTRLGCAGEVRYVASNATISLLSMLDKYPGPIQLMAIQFPDPHFKRRHYKRRIFQPQMVRDVTQLIAPGGLLFLQSDVLDVAVAMRNIFEKYAGHAFEVSQSHAPDSTFRAAPQPAAASLPEQQEAQDAQGQDPSDEGADASNQDAKNGQGRDEDDYLTMDSVWAARGWLRDNPLGVPTEREHYVMQQDMPVYRILLVRKT